MAADTLRNLLGNLTNGTSVSVSEPGPEELCARCGVLLELTEEGELRRHACCICRDTGRYRVRARPGDPDFGRTYICDHRGASAQPQRPAFDPIRQGIPYRLSGARLRDAGSGSGTKEARAMVSTWPPIVPMLTFLGEPGRGKSWLAAAILRAAYEQHGVLGWMADYPALMDRLRATQDGEEGREDIEKVTDMLLRLPLLVLDDVGKGRQSKFTDERLYRVIASREAANEEAVSVRDPDKARVTVVTANLPEFQALEPSLKSRLMGGLVVTFEGPDRRGTR